MKPGPKHIAVIRLSAMGDVAMMLPVLLAVIKAQPNIKITLISRDRFAPIFAGIDQIQFLGAEVYGKHKGIIGLWRLAKSIKGLSVDAVADLHHVLRSHVLSLFLKWSGLPVATIFKDRKAKQHAVKSFDPEQPWFKSSHERYAEVFRSLGLTVALTPDVIATSSKRPDGSADFLQGRARPFIGIAPFAAFPGKVYPEGLMQELISKIKAQFKGTVLLFGAPGAEQKTLDQWALVGDDILNCAGMGSFTQELNLLNQLDIMVAMDSGNGHLAANFGVPVITLWGVTHPCFGFVPFAQPIENQLCADRRQFPLIPTSIYGKTLPKGYDQVMSTIVPKTIINRIMTLLEKDQP